MKIFFVFFILYTFFFNCIHSKEFCSNVEPIVTLDETNCNPRIIIENSLDFDDILIEPNPISKSFSFLYYLYVFLDFGTTYQISFVNYKCTENIIKTYQTKNGPRFISSKGVCAGSKGSIEFIPDPEKSLNDYSFYIFDQVSSIPFSSVPGSYLVEAKIGEESQCKTTITIPNSNMQTERKPQVKLTNRICGDINGEIQVLNYDDYSNTFLQNKFSNEFVEQRSPGVYSNLESGEYILTTIDNTCGELQYHYFLKDHLPSYQLEIVDNSCPNAPLMKLTMNSSTLSYYIQKPGGENVSNPFIANNHDPQGYFIRTQCGDFNFQVSLPSTYPQIQYTAEDTADYCSPYRITLLYNSEDFTNLQVLDDLNETIQLDQNKSFIATMNSLYYISDTCYSEKLIIGKTYPKPFLKYIKKGKICSDRVDIQVLNWQDFSSIELRTYGDVYFQYSMENGGIIRNVLYQELMVNYIYRGCSTIQTTTFGEKSIDITLNDIDYRLNILEYPKCSTLQGLGNLTIYNKDTKEFLGWRVSNFTYNHSGDKFPFNFGYLMYNCYVNIDGITIDNYEIPEPVVTITTITNSTCQYADGDSINGKIRIDSSEYINIIKANGRIAWRGGSEKIITLDASYGYLTYTLIFDGICQPQNFTHFVDANDNFSLSYEIVNVTDCSQPNGALLVHNWDQVDYIEVRFIATENSEAYYPNSEHWYLDLPSGIYQITLKKTYGDGSYCQGSYYVFIPTSLEVDISHSILSKPMCSNDYDGLILFDYVTFRDQTTRKVDAVFYDYDIRKGDGIVDYVYPGDYIFNVTSGGCSWVIPFTLPMEPISYTYETLWYYQNDACSIEFGYQFYFNNYKASHIYVDENEFTNYDNGLLYGSISSSLDVQFNIKNQCGFTFTIDIDQSLVKPKLNYSITRYPVCNSGDETYDIEILNPSNWFSLMFDNKSIDSSGVFKNVAKNARIFGIEKNTNCAIDFIFSGSPDDNLIVDKEIKDETCLGSKNGELLFSNNNVHYNYYPFIYSSTYSEQVLLPLLNSNDSNRFYDISSEHIKIEMIRKDRSKLLSTCKQFDEATVAGNEPTLIDNSNDICSIDSFGTIDVKPSIEGLQYQANLIYNGRENLFTSKLDNVQPGQYILDNYKITTDYCKRSFSALTINVGASIFSLNITSTPCQSVIITPSINSTYSNNDLLSYNYNITTPSNSSIQFIKSGTLTIESLKDIGQYNLIVSDGHCIQTHKFNISQCTSNDGGGSGTKIGLAVGLSIGLIVLCVIIVVGVFFYRKRVKPIKTNELLPERYSMETVTTFQGGHLVELDKF
ncbi:hypothetical protein ACTFIU_003933 [Dictyostelium citrinum]